MVAEAAFNTTINITAQPPVALTDEATTNAGDNINYAITNSAKRYLDLNTAVVVQAKYDEVQTITITGSPTGGTFTLTFGGNTTATINWNDPASTVQTRLQALASIGAGNALVTGGPGPGTPFTVEFSSTLGYASQALITLGTNSLTGGTSPNVSITRAQAGSGFATVSATLYTLKHAGGIVVFGTPTIGTAVVRIHSGSYYVYSAMLQGHTADVAAKVAALDVTSFNSAGTESYIGGLLSAQIKLDRWWLDNVRATSLTARDLVVVDVTTPSGRRYEGYQLATDLGIKSDVKSAVGEALTFQVNQEFFAN